ncbi:MAG: hypothetical protein ACREBA_02615 [Nitrosotalea sp.]
MHNKLIFDGGTIVPTVELLVNHLGSIISMKDLYDIPRQSKIKEQKDEKHISKLTYEEMRRKYGVEKPHDTLEKLMKKIQQTIDSSITISNVMRLVYQTGKGYGFIIDDKALADYIKAQ